MLVPTDTVAQYVEQPAAESLRFLPDDPLWVDPDRLDVPQPAVYEPADLWDFVLNSFGDPGTVDGPAVNVNTLGEVPNSSWYTNRHYWNPMTLEQLAQGPNTNDGPSMEEPWRVVEGKSEGFSVGMQIIDARDDRYLLKFDPPGHPELSTGAEVIVTKLLYALGYYVPENFVVHFRPEQLMPDGEGTFVMPEGGEKPITQEYIDRLLARVHRYPDGSYRALASKFLSGDPVGPFQYFGTRPDDANDIFPHEGRRELRGLRVIAAWLNHYDARSANSLDMYVEEEGRQFVRHYLIDFGSTLGEGPRGPKRYWSGHEYAVDPGRILLRAVTLGFGGSEWVDIPYSERPSVGRLEAEHFEPDAWKPQYPNPAFRRADPADKFWAARQIRNVSDEAIQAIVATARYSDANAERYVTDALIARRDKIAEAYLHFGGGVDRFRVEEGKLVFDDLLWRYGLVESEPERMVVWYAFDNETGRTEERLERRSFRGESVPIPETEERFLLAATATKGKGSTNVYLRRSGVGYEVVGVRRTEVRGEAVPAIVQERYSDEQEARRDLRPPTPVSSSDGCGGSAGSC